MNLPYQKHRAHSLSKREKSYDLSSSNDLSQKEKSYINKITINLATLPLHNLLTDSEIMRYLYLNNFQGKSMIKKTI